MNVYDLLAEFVREQHLITDKYSRILASLQNLTPLNLRKRNDRKIKQKKKCQHCGKEYTSRLPLQHHIQKYHTQVEISDLGSNK